MKDNKKIAIVLTLTLAPVLAVGIYGLINHLSKKNSVEDQNAYEEIDWRLLREYDFQSGVKPENFAKLEGKPVKIPGFVVPLDDDQQAAAEFLLVPSPQACIHVPPPPANQMILVRMKGQAPKRSFGPVWIMGRIFLSTQKSQYGETSYMMTGESAEPYRNQD